MSTAPITLRTDGHAVGGDDVHRPETDAASGPAGASRSACLTRPHSSSISWSEHVGERAARRPQARLHGGEPVRELVVGLPERRLGLDAELPGEVGDGEEQVAHLLFGAFAVGAGARADHPLAQLGHLLLDLGHDVRGAFPVEADRRGPDADFVGAQERGQGPWGRRRARCAARPWLLFSRAFRSSQRSTTSSGVVGSGLPASPASSGRPNTCGWRRTSLSEIACSESATVKSPDSAQSWARRTPSKMKSPSSSQSAWRSSWSSASSTSYVSSRTNGRSDWSVCSRSHGQPSRGPQHADEVHEPGERGRRRLSLGSSPVCYHAVRRRHGGGRTGPGGRVSAAS